MRADDIIKNHQYSATLAVLFRRRGCKGEAAVGKLVGDACAKAIRLMAHLDPVQRLQVYYGSEKTYSWVRIEAVAIGENVVAPKGLCRNANGRLRPRHI